MAEMEVDLAAMGGLMQIYPRLIEARVEIFHGAADEASEVRLVPNIQFVVKVPMDDAWAVTKWALAPAGEKRFGKATLTLFGRAREPNSARKWTMHRAYLHHYQEVEFPPDPHHATSQENAVEVVIRGIVLNGEDYDGDNISSMFTPVHGGTGPRADSSGGSSPPPAAGSAPAGPASDSPASGSPASEGGAPASSGDSPGPGSAS